MTFKHTYDSTMSSSMLSELYELEKRALDPIWAGRLITGGVGAIGGGLLGRHYAPEDQKTYGTVRGSILGGLAGGLGGQFVTQAGGRQALHFGQRQLHGVTGYLPGRGIFGNKEIKGVQSIKGGTDAAKAQRVKELNAIDFEIPEAATQEKALEAAKKSVDEGFFSGFMPQKVRDYWSKRVAKADLAKRQLAEEGMTSVPGLVRGLVGKSQSGLNPLEAARLNLRAPGFAMGVAAPMAMTGLSVNDYRQTGDKGALAGDIAGNTAMALTAGLPIAPMMAAQSLVGRAGRLVGRGVEAGQQMLANRAAPPVQQPVGQVLPAVR